MDPHTQADSRPAELLTRQEVSRLLRSVQCFNPFMKAEEDRRPWSCKVSGSFDRPLLRIWDYRSGSQPDDDGRMLSRAPRSPLDTREARENSLTVHPSHKIWIPTPYISFTTSATGLTDLACMRTRNNNRGLQTLTVIDPDIRIRRGLPVLDIAAEMEYYSIQDPYDQGYQYYDNHYICLWEVTPEEVVGHWEWDEWATNENWYEEVVMPAFKKFRETRRSDSGLSPLDASGSALVAAPASASAFDMSTIFENLPGQFSVPVNRDQLTSKFVSADILQALPHFRNLEKGDSYDKSKTYIHDCDSYDTDDEVEEANLNDDIIRGIEGGR
jgi:hypothetical protein